MDRLKTLQNDLYYVLALVHPDALPSSLSPVVACLDVSY